MSRILAFAATCGGRVARRCGRAARRAGIMLLASIALALPAASRGEAAPSSVVLQLNGPATFEYAGYYAALWKGFYAAAGLAVEIRPGGMLGQPAIDPARELTSGNAQFGVGSMSLVVRAGQGMPLVLLAPVFQASGTRIYYRSDADFASPGALAKANLGRYAATDIRQLELATALRGDGIDPNKVRSTATDPDRAVDALADRHVDAVAGSAWIVPWQARARGLSLKSINPADYRVEFYGDTLFTLARFVRDDPDIVRRFRAASLKGWAYALDHSDEIAARLAKDLPRPPGITDAAGFARYQIGVARELARYPAVPLGHSSLDRWSRIERTLVDTGAMVLTSRPESFVYDAQPGTSGGRGGYIAMIIAAALIAAAAIGALLVWRRRQAAAPTAASPVAAAPLSPPETEATTAAAKPPEPAVQSAPAAAETAAPAVEAVPSTNATPATVDLNGLLASLEPAMRARMPATAQFRLSLLPELWPCRTEREALGSLVVKLVGAAVGALRPSDTLIVGTRNTAFDANNVGDFPGACIGEFARITVRDSGPGMDEETLGRIFDPAATSRPAVAAARPAMQRLGGYVRAESAEGIGTAIHLYFPRLAEPAAAEKPAPEPAAAPEEPTPSPPPKRYKASGSRATQRRSRSLR